MGQGGGEKHKIIDPFKAHDLVLGIGMRVIEACHELAAERDVEVKTSPIARAYRGIAIHLASAIPTHPSVLHLLTMPLQLLADALKAAR